MKDLITWLPPFAKTMSVYRRRSLTKYTKQAGVYFIKENDVIVYIGMSASNVVEALYRHFYPWRDCYRGKGTEYRTTYVDKLDSEQHKYEVAVMVVCYEQVSEMERALIWSLKPRDNRHLYDDYFETKQADVTEDASVAEYEETPF